MHIKGTHIAPKTDAEKLADSAFRALAKLDALAPGIRYRAEFDILAFDARRVKEREQAMREMPYV